MGWMDSFDPYFFGEIDVSMDCLMCDYYQHGECTKEGECYWDEVWRKEDEEAECL